MKVILLRDVAKIGRRYETVIVPDGFALNKLIPKGDAQAATPDNVKRIMNLRQKNQADKASALDSLQKIAAEINLDPLVIPAQANAQGHLFKGVHADDVMAAALKRGISIPKEYLVVENHLKSLGTHEAALKIQGEVFTFTINVVAK
jgi:large subunit ribosomal protein L9